MLPADATDEQLIALAQGDGPLAPLAAERLLSAQIDRLYAVCFSVVRQPETAAELSQEALLRLHRSLHRYRGDCSWNTWTYRVARNLCLNWLEKMREEPGADPTRLIEPTGTPLDLTAAGERSVAVQAALDTALDEEERTAVRLHYEAGLSVNEVTEEMGLTNRSGARGVLQRARRKLRAAFAETMPEDSVVRRATQPSAEVRAAMERTLHELTRAPGRDQGEEPRVREMRARQSLID
ncbi:MAG: sigma-70 family RNA polymerase sigma factor [Alphaproteobacteria bacterium]|nr:sigma-70 family RNA polymerase sigma factor [Alphaproteobacteria bacterium]